MLTGAHEALAEAAGSAISESRARILRLRRPDGTWDFGSSAGPRLAAGLILLEIWRGAAEPDRAAALVRSVLETQTAGGGFPAYPGGAADLDTTVLCYAALKLAGVRPDAPEMAAARECALNLGGAQDCATRTRLELRLFGFPGPDPFPVPPEIALDIGVLNRMPVLRKAEMLALGLLSGSGAARPAHAAVRLDGISRVGPETQPPRPEALELRFGWAVRFLASHPFGPVRRRALRKCAELLEECLPEADGPGERFTALRYALMACEAHRCAPGHPLRAKAEAQLARLVCESDGRIGVLPCVTALRDTALAAIALEQPAQSGDGAPGGANRLSLPAFDPETGKRYPEHYPVESLRRSQQLDGSWFGSRGSIHATCRALIALAGAGVSDRDAEVLRGGEWLRSVQNADGGWGERRGRPGAFVPAPSNAVHTAWAVTGLVAGGDADSMSVRAGAAWLIGRQRPDGGWDDAGAAAAASEDAVVYGSDSIVDPLLALLAYTRAAHTESRRSY